MGQGQAERGRERQKDSERTKYTRCQVVNENCIACRLGYCVQRVPFAHLLLSCVCICMHAHNLCYFQHFTIQFYISLPLNIRSVGFGDGERACERQRKGLTQRERERDRATGMPNAKENEQTNEHKTNTHSVRKRRE